MFFFEIRDYAPNTIHVHSFERWPVVGIWMFCCSLSIRFSIHLLLVIFLIMLLNSIDESQINLCSAESQVFYFLYCGYHFKVEMIQSHHLVVMWQKTCRGKFQIPEFVSNSYSTEKSFWHHPDDHPVLLIFHVPQWSRLRTRIYQWVEEKEKKNYCHSDTCILLLRGDSFRLAPSMTGPQPDWDYSCA